MALAFRPAFPGEHADCRAEGVRSFHPIGSPLCVGRRVETSDSFLHSAAVANPRFQCPCPTPPGGRPWLSYSEIKPLEPLTSGRLCEMAFPPFHFSQSSSGWLQGRDPRCTRGAIGYVGGAVRSARPAYGTHSPSASAAGADTPWETVRSKDVLPGAYSVTVLLTKFAT
jgi:hypothetical protein